ncbi:MAG: glycosyltransferase family 2 protein [Patescibacteria group bacterium]|nr:glycosyltransferase family 2 protein [Patescibacteria group bacterium]
MKKNTLSVVIVNFNTRELLKNCLESIFKQETSFELEIIVVDNGSTDGSVGYLKSQKSKVKAKVQNVKLGKERKQFVNSATRQPDQLDQPDQPDKPNNLITIFNSKNFGFAKANNQAIKKSKGEWVFLLNSDTIVKRDALEKLVAFAWKGNGVGAVAPMLLNFDGSVQPSCYHSLSALTAFKEFWLGKAGAFSKYALEDGLAVEVEAAVGAALLLPKRIIDKVGLLNEKYFMYFEDLDYCRKIRQSGFKVFYLPEAKIVHLHGQSGKKLDDKPNRWLIESSKKYYGSLNYYLINFIIWSGQKWQRLRKFLSPR